MTTNLVKLTTLAFVAIPAVLFPATLSAQQTAESMAIIPRPVSAVPAAGRFTLTPGTVIWTDRTNALVGRQLSDYLEPATGLAIPARVGTSASGNRIVIRRDTSLSRLGREGYRLEVRPGRITVRAPTATGAFYAVQTIRQLLPPEIFREAPVNLSTTTDSQYAVRNRQSSQSAIRNLQFAVAPGLSRPSPSKTSRVSVGVAGISMSPVISCPRSSSRST